MSPAFEQCVLGAARSGLEKLFTTITCTIGMDDMGMRVVAYAAGATLTITGSGGMLALVDEVVGTGMFMPTGTGTEPNLGCIWVTGGPDGTMK